MTEENVKGAVVPYSLNSTTSSKEQMAAPTTSPILDYFVGGVTKSKPQKQKEREEDASKLLFVGGPLHGTFIAVPTYEVHVPVMKDYLTLYDEWLDNDYTINDTTTIITYCRKKLFTGKRMIVVMTVGGEECRLDEVFDAMAVALYFTDK